MSLPIPLLKSSRNARAGVSIVEAFKNALWTALRNMFRPKMHSISGFFIYSPEFFSGGKCHGPPQKRRRCLDPDTNVRLARPSMLIFAETWLKTDCCGTTG